MVKISLSCYASLKTLKIALKVREYDDYIPPPRDLPQRLLPSIA